MILQGKGRAYRNALRKFIDKLYTKVSNFVNVFSRENAILSLFFRNFSSFSAQKKTDGTQLSQTGFCLCRFFGTGRIKIRPKHLIFTISTGFCQGTCLHLFLVAKEKSVCRQHIGATQGNTLRDTAIAHQIQKHSPFCQCVSHGAVALRAGKDHSRN